MTPADVARPAPAGAGPGRARRLAGFWWGARSHRFRAALVCTSVLCALLVLMPADAMLLSARVRHLAVRLPAAGVGRTWLLVGSDSRAAAPAGSSGRFGSPAAVPGARADVIVIVHQWRGHTSTLTVPRDLLLPTRSGAIERATLSLLDGAQGLVDGLCRGLGVPVTHVALLSMDAFVRLVDALGGLPVTVPQPVRDAAAGLSVTATGRVRLSGTQALAFVRSRHPQYLRRGRWVAAGERDGEAARLESTSLVFAALREQARRAGHHPVTAQRVAWTATGGLTTDRGTGLLDLLTLARSAPPPTALPAAPVDGTLAVQADAGTRAAVVAAGYTGSCVPAAAD